MTKYAFPTPADPGATLRDYFAAAALQGLMRHRAFQEGFVSFAEVSRDAYRVADAMLKARQQEPAK